MEAVVDIPLSSGIQDESLKKKIESWIDFEFYFVNITDPWTVSYNAYYRGRETGGATSNYVL